MKILVNLISGESYSFDAKVDRPVELMSKIKPVEFFKRPLHQFLGSVKTVSINPSCIEWLELETDDFPKITPFGRSLTIRQLSQEAFKSWVSKDQAAISAMMKDDVNQNVLIAYGMASFKSGRSLYFQLNAKIAGSQDRMQFGQKIFQLPALLIYGEVSGMFIVNPANIAVWQVVPGLKKSSYFSLPGELTGVKKAR